MVIIGKSTTKLKPRNNSQLSKPHQPATCQTGAERGGERELARDPLAANVAMENAPVTAATGALGPVIAKLAALLGSEYKLRWCTRRDVKFIRSKLKPVHSILWNIWEREELDDASKALKLEALDLADDLEDTIVDFIFSLERSHNSMRLIQTKIKASPFQDFKKRANDVSGRCRSKWKEMKKPAAADSGPSKPRSYPFVRKDASELVGMAEQRNKLINHLVEEDKTAPVQLQLKTAFINGMAGMGKTTLADLVYEAIGDKFQARAFVSLTPGDNMREVLARVLHQLEANSSAPVAGTQAATKEEHLIEFVSNFLEDKRYLVIIDDIWNWRDWEVVMKSLPENNLGSRIVATTRMNDVAEKWRKHSHGPALLHQMVPKWNDEKGWVYDIANRMVAMKADLVAEGFDSEHPIVHMCGGTPLAVLCMLSAVAKQREKEGHHAHPCEVQDKIEKHVKENGIQNTPGFEPWVESLQLCYDDLPHHMIKTCLLHCSIYPSNSKFRKRDFVRAWIAEGFAYEEEEANGYFEELVNRGLIMYTGNGYSLTMHPMMRNFLRWKSCQDNFITCSSEMTPSYNTCRIRRLCIDNLPYRSTDEAAGGDRLSALDWSHIRSLVVVCDGIDSVPFEKLEGVRVLDLCKVYGLSDHHMKDICGLVCLRHLLGLDGGSISEIPQEIVRLQWLETFEESGKRLPGFIGKLQQLKTLEVTGYNITELPGEIGALHQLQTLKLRTIDIQELPREVWSLQQLKTLDISYTKITELPKEIGELQQLRTLDISYTKMTELPKEMVKLQKLEHLLMKDTKVAKIPREMRALKSLILHDRIAALPLEACGALAELPECIHQALNNSGLVSELAGEMLSLQNGGLVVGAKQMHIPPWIKEHFNDLVSLDIRICRLDEGGLKILREMPQLRELTLRFEVVPREPISINSQGFVKLTDLTVDSRVPRVTFQEGAMPRLLMLTFQFQFYAGPPYKHPVGVNHLGRLQGIYFKCNEDWYGGADSQSIRPTIDVVRKEAQAFKNIPWFFLEVCGRKEKICSPQPSPPPLLETMGQQHDMKQGETEEEERSSGFGEIEDNQA